MNKMLVSLVLLLSLQQGASAQVPQEPAGTSAYLVGVIDTREERTTLLQIVNPTTARLRLFLAFFDDSENLLNCIGEELSGNDLFEFDARQGFPGNMVGVVKVVTLAMDEARPQIGVIGNQRLNIGRQPVAETGLHPIQMAFLEAELSVIKERCGF